MTSLEFAVELEEEIIRQIEFLARAAPPGPAKILAALARAEKNFSGLVKKAGGINLDLEPYPAIDAEKLLGEDFLLQGAWQAKMNLQENLCVLLMVCALIEKSTQYYQQAALNSPHPSLRLFLRSLAEVKNIQRGRLAACVRVAYNEVWEEVGFAPFLLGKD